MCGPGDDTAPSGPDPQAWRIVDWRFLLPDPWLGRVWAAPQCAREAADLSAIGIDVVQTLGESIDTVLVESGHCDINALERDLSPGTMVRIALTAERVGLSRASLQPFSTWRAALEGRGWRVLSCAWAAPGLGWTRAYAEIDQRRAISHALAMVYDNRSIATRLKVRVAQTIVRLGGQELICREGIILARTPS